MIFARSTICSTIAAAALALMAGQALAAGPVVLTVTGAVENTNRDAINPDFDKLFVFNDTSFDKAMEFDLEGLAALPQTTVRTDFPLGGDLVEYSGPALAEVLSAAGATGDTVTVQALDGYAVDVPYTEMIDKGAVLALSRDGTPLGIGSFGPAQIVFPRGEREDLAEMPDDWWVWQIYHISVK